MKLSTIITRTQSQLDALMALPAATETLEAMGLRVEVFEAGGSKPCQIGTAPKPQENKAEPAQLVDQVTAPSKPDQKPTPAKNGRSKYVPGARWTPYEDDRAVEMAVAGKTAPQIAKALSRPEHGTAYRLRTVLAERIRAAEAIDEGIDVDPAPATPKPVIAPQSPPAPCNGFTAAMDVRLVEMICQGWKVPQVAKEMGITEDAAGARWNEIKPDHMTFEAQTKLLAQLRHIAAQQQAAE